MTTTRTMTSTTQAIRLAEHEYDDLRRILDGLPTTTTTREVTLEGDCCDLEDECLRGSHNVTGDVEVETFSAADLDRYALAELVERIGEIYDAARARAIVAAMDASSKVRP